MDLLRHRRNLGNPACPLSLHSMASGRMCIRLGVGHQAGCGAAAENKTEESPLGAPSPAQAGQQGKGRVNAPLMSQLLLCFVLCDTPPRTRLFCADEPIPFPPEQS